MHQQHALLARLVAILGASSVLELGAAHEPVSPGLSDDVSVVAFEAATSTASCPNKLLRGGRRYHDICAAPLPDRGDLTVCLDLLIYLQEPECYQNAVKHLAESAGALFISGFNDQPVQGGPSTYFHEPLSQTLKRYGRTGIPIAGYQGLVVFLVLPPQQKPMPPLEKSAFPRDRRRAP